MRDLKSFGPCRNGLIIHWLDFTRNCKGEDDDDDVSFYGLWNAEMYVVFCEGEVFSDLLGAGQVSGLCRECCPASDVKLVQFPWNLNISATSCRRK